VADVRIVSLLPSATEIAVALGLGDRLVGRSHECDYPAWVERLPVCTATKLEKGLTSRQIDDRVREIIRQGLSVYEVDAELLRSLEPDLILTQSQCAICAVTPADLEEALNSWVGRKPAMLSLAPDRLDDVWTDFRRVAEAAGVPEAGARVVDGLKTRLEALDDGGARTTVAAIEWIDPPMVAGNWIPELIELACGRPAFQPATGASAWIELEALASADPDVLIVMPCGYRIEQSMRELVDWVEQPRVKQLRAVREGRLFVADGHHFFNRPGPRLVESAEMIAQMLAAPVGVDRAVNESWLRVAHA
jgi:iron complex transport system substrate-binding protein